MPFPKTFKMFGGVGGNHSLSLHFAANISFVILYMLILYLTQNKRH